MTIHVSWHDDTHTIGLMTFDGAYQWEEVYQAQRQMSALYQTVKHPVCTIVDYRNAGPPPDDVFMNLARLATTRPDSRVTVLIGLETNLLTAAADIYSRVFGGLHRADNLTEAELIIQSIQKHPAITDKPNQPR